MKLSKRELFMLFGLGIIIVIYLLYSLILTPQFIKLKSQKEQLEEFKTRQQMMKIQISPTNKIYSDFKIINKRVYDMSSYFYPEIKQDKLMLTIQEIISGSDVRIKNITYTDPQIGNINEQDTSTVQDNSNKSSISDLVSKYNSQNVKKNESEEEVNQSQTEVTQDQTKKQEIMLEKMTVTIDLEGSYSGILDVIKKIDQYKRNLIIDNLVLNSQDSGLVGANFSIDINCLPKLEKQDEDYYSWDIINTYGKSNLFSGGISNVQQDVKTSNISVKNDFIMTIKPISSDLPTVILGKADRGKSDTYVYADNKDTENVELVLSKTGDKYFYKYKTERESYPKDYNTGVEFRPMGSSISLSIISSPRNDKNDNSGVNIFITNNTDKQLNVSISNDDKNSRVKFARKTGIINIYNAGD